MKVLIIDDDNFVRNVLVSQFTQENISSVTSMDGEDGYVRAVAELPDVIILDLILPKIDGYELLKKIKKNAKLAHIKVIVFSGLAQDHDKNEAIASGADVFFSKEGDSIARVVEWVRTLQSSSM